ncbi:MAG: hypothetical protein WDO16_23695 [Bacteroidota bacterium]
MIILISFPLFTQRLQGQVDTMEMKAIQSGNSLISNIKNNREYISVLNELLAKTEYLKYRDYSDMLAWWYNVRGNSR